MTVLVNIVVGLVMGGFVAVLANLIKKPGHNQVKKISFDVICLAFGALGAVSADQLLVYGPTFLGVSILPSIVGGLVLAFVAAYPMKRWLNF